LIITKISKSFTGIRDKGERLIYKREGKACSSLLVGLIHREKLRENKRKRYKRNISIL